MFDRVRNPTCKHVFLTPSPQAVFFWGGGRASAKTVVPRVGKVGSTLEIARTLYFKLQLHQTQTRFCHRASGLGLPATPLALWYRLPLVPTPSAQKDGRDAQRRALLPEPVLQMGDRASAGRLGVGGECEQVSVL